MRNYGLSIVFLLFTPRLEFDFIFRDLLLSKRSTFSEIRIFAQLV